MIAAVSKTQWAARLKKEVAEDILPFWARHAVDREHGGFYGKIDCDLKVDAQAPRSAVIDARILWTYAAACRLIDPTYREMADRAWSYIVDKFWDAEYGGIYWTVDYLGNAISNRKQIYAQAFAIYGILPRHRQPRESGAHQATLRIHRSA
jgi:mannobiose 2-epimerase